MRGTTVIQNTTSYFEACLLTSPQKSAISGLSFSDDPTGGEVVMRDRKYLCPKWAEILLTRMPPLFDRGPGGDKLFHRAEKLTNFRTQPLSSWDWLF